MLTLAALQLGFADLFGKRHAALVKSRAGKYYEPKLVKLRDDIAALPPQVVSGAPLAEELAVVDGEHDGFGAVIYFITEAALRHPALDPKIVAAAGRVRTTFIPKLAELKATYETEAHRAQERMKQLEVFKADLELFPVPGGGTLHDVATAFLERGSTLSDLLSGRGDAPTNARTGAGTLRAKAVGVLGRMRAEITDNLDEDEKLPRDLVAKVFGYFDTLDAMNAAAVAAKAGHDGGPESPIGVSR